MIFRDSEQAVRFAFRVHSTPIIAQSQYLSDLRGSTVRGQSSGFDVWDRHTVAAIVIDSIDNLELSAQAAVYAYYSPPDTDDTEYKKTLACEACIRLMTNSPIHNHDLLRFTVADWARLTHKNRTQRERELKRWRDRLKLSKSTFYRITRGYVYRGKRNPGVVTILEDWRHRGLDRIRADLENKGFID